MKSRESRLTGLGIMAYMREQTARLSRGHEFAKAIQHTLERWPAFTLFLDDGSACISNNASC